MCRAQPNRRINRRGRDCRLIGDGTSNDRSSNESCRREPEAVVMPVTTPILPISTMSIVVANSTTALEMRTSFTPVINTPSIVIAPELDLLDMIARRFDLHARHWGSFGS
jgi:hypothetical protein